MKITFDWLKDHLKTNFKEKNLLEQLTNIGLEVESVGSLSTDNEKFKITIMSISGTRDKIRTIKTKKLI